MELGEGLKEIFQDALSYFPSTSPVILYRALDIKNIHELDLNNLGIYWTTEEASARCYRGKTEDTGILIKTSVSSEAIDWITNINRQVDHYLESGGFEADENEVTLLPKKHINVTGYRNYNDHTWTPIKLSGLT